MNYILSALSIYLVGLLISSGVSDAYSAVIYDVGTSLQILIITIGIYKLIPMNKISYKLICLVYGALNLWDLVFFSVLYNLENSKYYDLVSTISESLIVGLLFFFATTLLIGVKRSFNKYTKCGSFIVYRKARSLQGFISSLVTYPYGQCFLVVGGKEFKFKGGRIIERDHVSKDIYSYRRVEDIRLGNARALLGMKWSIFNNCFTVFQKFGDLDRARDATDSSGSDK